ncbi:hypothetical protein G3T14_00905 [Methylobacterium sp. BTF04]|uniref:hypothetical protein n=1 Tax=Methylobacterium sp. BTF04 TaxID=2708300 RepID=UPI0013D2FB70|nr:hypothetical protein [Methylobacterium sp. BTF04]NEU10688.1 hypothetical protein [Methylobacterium sp. BTF04]
MRAWVYGMGTLLLIGGPVSAQQPARPRPAPAQKLDPTSDAKALELKGFIDKARLRQRAVDKRNTDLWQRWTYAVCIGCGGVSSGAVHLVYTTPARVLVGIPAAEDDARNAAVRHRIWRT